jgi:anti-sigma regulatory factor (Ser/Thr protein kinase)
VKAEQRISPREPGAVELRMDARAENLVLARLALTGVGAVARAPENVLADLKVAVTEACTNAIQHGYAAPDVAASVVVRYRIADGRIEVEVEDNGRGFDPNDPGASTPEDARSQGMGLMIIRALTDELLVDSDASGSRITFAKTLSQSLS